jgi:hypothetical protein
MTSVDPGVIDWLLEGDPAIRWQVMRDLQDRPESEVERERAKVATEGWGAALLAEQAADGSWAGGLYTPKWTSTFYTLLQLVAMGLPRDNPRARAAAALLFERGSCADGGLHFAVSTVALPARPGRLGELCVTGMGLRMLATYLPEPARTEPIAKCLLATQLLDGGWNCQRSSRHGSFNTTVSALEGLQSGRLRLVGAPRSKRPLRVAGSSSSHTGSTGLTALGGGQLGDDAVHVPLPLALRRHAWARLLPVGRCAAGRAAHRRDRTGQIAAKGGRAVADAGPPRRARVPRDGSRWRAIALEHAPGLAGPAMVGR